MEFHEVGYGIVAPRTNMGTWGSSWNQAQTESMSQWVGLIRIREIGTSLCGFSEGVDGPKGPSGGNALSSGNRAAKYGIQGKEVPDTLSATKGLVGETSEGYQQSLGTGFTHPIHPSYTQQLKLEPPAKYSGQRGRSRGTGLVNARRNGISDWAVFLWRTGSRLLLWGWMGRQRPGPMRLLLEVFEGKRMPYTWDEFRTRMIARFESVTENEEARRELRELHQTRRVAGYTTKFQELKSKLPTMTDEEAFSVYLVGLNPIWESRWGPT